MKTDSAWVATILSGPNDNSLHVLDSNGASPARQAMRKAKKPRPEDLPVVLYPRYRDEDIQNLPELFVDAGNLVFSNAIAEVFRGFDLGSTYMVPAKIVLSDHQTEIHTERGYVIMNRFKVVEALVPEESHGIRPRKSQHAMPNTWKLERGIEDDDIALSARHLDVPPIWGSGNLSGVTFFRGDVVEALEAAGAAHHWRFKRCRIVE